jgi:hypothetical protein
MRLWPDAPELILTAARDSGQRIGPAMRVLFALSLFCFIVVSVPEAHAQQAPDTTRAAVVDTLQALPVLPETALPDTLSPPDTTLVPLEARPAGTGERTLIGGKPSGRQVTFSARDSLVITFGQDGGDIASLFGKAEVAYQDAELEAYNVDILFDIEELRARGLEGISGPEGRPQFRQGDETFTGRELAFNLRTEQGRVVAARTAMDEGFIHGGIVKLRDPNTAFIQDGRYTTCECEDDPSYTLRANRMKVVDQEWVYTGPIQLYLFNIPTPLWLPFGFLPATEGRRSGLLPVDYGEDDRGFYLRNFGWYQAINDYMDAQVRLGLWTSGSWQVSPLYRYARRDFYTGSLQVDYVRNRLGMRGDPDFTVIRTSSLRWNHNQTVTPTIQLSGDVNLTTRDYMRTISESYEDRVAQTISSNVRYNQRWPSANRSLNVGLSQSQTLATGAVSMTIPNLSFSQGTRYPFRSAGRTPGQRDSWLERITYSYNASLDNRYSFQPLNDSLAAEISWWDALFSPSQFQEATGRTDPFSFRATHRVPVGTSFSLERLPLLGTPLRLNINPSVNYTEDWFIQTQRRFLDGGQLRMEQVPGFFSLRRFSAGVSANTTIYGLFPLRVGPYDGVRHTLRPTLSWNYTPDYFSPFWGYTRTFTAADDSETRYPIVSGISPGMQQTMSLSLDNVFETRRVQVDSEGGERRQSVRLFNLSANGAYNFAADSFRVSNISLNGRTTLFGQVNVNMNATLSPYRLDSEGTRPINEFVFSPQNPFPARMTNFRVSATTALRSSTRTGDSRPAVTPREAMLLEVDPHLEQDLAMPSTAISTPYADFSIPWSLNLDFSYSVARPFATTRRQATVNARSDLSLTPNWMLNVTTGYDLIGGEMALTDVRIMRDFECWQMSFSWVPFGPYQSYGFQLYVKSGQLTDLLRISQPRSDVRGRFTDRLP